MVGGPDRPRAGAAPSPATGSTSTRWSSGSGSTRPAILALVTVNPGATRRIFNRRACGVDLAPGVPAALPHRRGRQPVREPVLPAGRGQRLLLSGAGSELLLTLVAGDALLDRGVDGPAGRGVDRGRHRHGAARACPPSRSATWRIASGGAPPFEVERLKRGGDRDAHRRLPGGPGETWWRRSGWRRWAGFSLKVAPRGA